MKSAVKALGMGVVLSFAIISISCAQEDQRPFRYTQENREEVRQNMQQTAQELGQLTSDFKNFYRDLQEAVQSSGIYDGLDMGPTGFGSADIRVKDENMIVVMDLPGIEKDDLKVRLRDAEVLEVEGERNADRIEEAESEGRSYYRQDRHRGSFSRAVKLPYKAALGKQFKAEYRNGILTVVIPMEAPPAAKVVEIPVS